MVDEATVAKKLAEKFPETLPAKMAEMGITAVAEEVFLKGAFVVIRVSIVSCDIEKLLSHKLD